MTSQQAPAPAVVCPQCGKRFRWRTEFAGKELGCPCGQSFKAPAAPTPGAAPAAPPPLKHSYALPAGGKSAVERALEAREDEAQLSRAREFIVPAILLPVGAFAGLVAWTQWLGTSIETLLVWGAAVAIQTLVFWPAGLVAASTVAKWFELGLGRLSSVLLKLAALTLGPAALGDVIFLAIMVNTDFDWWSVVAGYGVYLVLCGLPALYLFEMAVYEGALWVLLIFLPRIVGAYVIAASVADFFR